MKKTLSILSAIVLSVILMGCRSATDVSIWKANAGGFVRAHAWESPHLDGDLSSNPVHSELGLGFLTVGSHAGWAPDGKWLSFSTSVGEDSKPDAGK